MDERKRRVRPEQGRRVSLVGPVILIGLGIILLLNNLGILEWSVWEVILRLWPVLLIAWGLDLIIGRRSIWGSLLALVLIVALLAGALWLFGAGIGTGRVVAAEEIRQALDGATQAEVVIAPAVGTLHVEALPESANLVEGAIRLGSGERATPDFTVEDETATFTLRSEGVAFGPFVGSWDDQRGWDLGLNPDVPLELEISLSVGRSDVDLTGLTVSDLEVSMGVGQTTVILPDEGRFRAKIEGAVGQTIVVIPEGMAARIHVDTGLAGRQLPDEYQRHGDIYTSPGYESADNRVDLEVSQAIGNIAIRHTRTR
jgi:hypothetical protein